VSSFIELVKILVTQEVYRVENCPAIFLKSAKISSLATKNYSTSIVVLNSIHHVLIRYKN